MADDEEVIVHIDPALIDADPSLAAIATEEKPKVVIEEKAKTGPAADDPVESLKGQLSTLQKRDETRERELADARRIATEAEQRANAATNEATAAKTEVVETQYDTVVNGIASAQSEADTAEQAYQAAFTAGDAVAASKAQRKISEAVSRLGRLEEAKADLEAVSKRTEKPAEGQRTQQQTTQRTAQTGDAVESFLATRTPKTAQWLRDHSDLATALAMRVTGRGTSDQNKLGARLTAAHNMAEADGLEADTPEYFESIEKFIGLKKEATKQQSQRRPGAPTTPVSHSGGGTNGGGVEVKLTQGEAKAATDGITLVWNYDDPSGQKRFKKGDAIGIQEAARRKLAMQKDGRYDKTYYES